jgi:hypothetical protein
MFFPLHMLLMTQSALTANVVVYRYGRSQEMTGEKDEEVNMICKERKWILDRMLLGPATGSDSADQAANNLECSSSKDLVVLQVI